MLIFNMQNKSRHQQFNQLRQGNQRVKVIPRNGKKGERERISFAEEHSSGASTMSLINQFALLLYHSKHDVAKGFSPSCH